MVKKYSQKRILRNKKSKSKKQKGGRKTRVRRNYSKNKQKGGATNPILPVELTGDILIKTEYDLKYTLESSKHYKFVIYNSNGDKYNLYLHEDRSRIQPIIKIKGNDYDPKVISKVFGKRSDPTLKNKTLRKYTPSDSLFSQVFLFKINNGKINNDNFEKLEENLYGSEINVLFQKMFELISNKNKSYPIKLTIRFTFNKRPVKWCSDLISFISSILNKEIQGNPPEDNAQERKKLFNIDDEHIHYEFKYVDPTMCELYITEDTKSKILEELKKMNSSGATEESPIAPNVGAGAGAGAGV